MKSNRNRQRQEKKRKKKIQKCIKEIQIEKRRKKEQFYEIVVNDYEDRK